MKTTTWRTILASIALLALGVSTWATETTKGGRTVHHSADFGWTANQDVTEQFTKLLTDGTLKAGEELVLDHTYRIDGQSKNRRVLPANFTLSAVKGAGFEVVNLPGKGVGPTVLELGDRNTLRNLSITCVGVPTEIRTPKNEYKFFSAVGVLAQSKNDILIENCLLDGAITHQIRLSGCERVKVMGCHIIGGFWSVCLITVNDIAFWRCLIEKCQGDGIKTVGSDKVCRNILVENCVFQDNRDDGIDTTGGFNDSVVRNTIFRRLRACGMDIKSPYFTRAKKGDIEACDPKNVNILIEKCTFHDVANSLVFTTSAGPHMLTPANVKKFAPHDIDINDCVFGYAEEPLPKQKGGYGTYDKEGGTHMHCILLKDAHSIRYRNMRLSGERKRIMPVLVESLGIAPYWAERYKKTNPGMGEALLSLHEQMKGKLVTGNVLDKPAPPIKPGVTEAPFTCGPQ